MGVHLLVGGRPAEAAALVFRITVQRREHGLVNLAMHITCLAISSLGRRLAVLVGRYSEAMGVAVIVSDKELGLSVVAIHYLRN